MRFAAAILPSTVWLVALLSSCTTPKDHRPRINSEVEARTGRTPAAKADARVTSLPPGIVLDEALTADQFVAVALWNNGAFQAALTELGFTRAEVIRAGQLANPTFSVLFPLGSKQLEFAAKFPLEALWLRPRRVAIAEKDAAAVAEQLVESGLNLVRDVRIACVELNLTHERLAAARAVSKPLAQTVKLAGARVQAGDASVLEATQTRADSELADREIVRLIAEEKLAEQKLRALVGLALRDRALKLRALPPPADCAQPVSELIRDALAARPELRAAELALESTGKRRGLAKSEIFALTGILDANGTGKDFEIGPGLELPIPILNQNQAARALADAQTSRAARQYVVVRDRIAADVRDAHTRLTQARDERAAWQQTLRTLETAARQAEKAFELGDVSRLASLDATRKLAEARAKATESDALQRRALAELERAVGHRLERPH